MNKKDAERLKFFGERLRELRREKKFTQEMLAHALNVEISQISRIERGVINTSLLNIISISDALDISPKDFFDA